MLRLSIAFLATTFAVVTPSLIAQVPASIYNRVLIDLGEQKYQEAEEALRAALRGNMQDAKALGLMGVILDAQRKYPEAESFYQRAIRLSPHSSPLFNNLGNHYLTQGKPELARRAYLRVVQIDVHDENANLQLAQMAIREKQGRNALHYLSQLGSEDQSQPGVQLLRARALKLAGETSAAEARLLATLKQSGGDPRVAFSAGMFFARWKRYKEAEEAFSKALDSTPDNLDALYNLGLAALDAGDLIRAGHTFRVALQQRPDDANCLAGLESVGKALLSRGSVPQALEIFNTIKASTSNRKLLAECGEALLNAKQYVLARDFLSSVSPSDAQTRLDLAIAVFHIEGAKSALAELDRIPAQERKGDYFLLQAQLLDAMGKPQQAAEALNRGFRAAPKREDLYLQAALFLVKHGRYPEMIKLLAETERVIPNDPRLQLIRAMGYEMLQRHEEAEDLLAQIESRWPDWYLPHEIHGIILSIQIEPDEAKSELKAAIALGDHNAETYFYLAWATITADGDDVRDAQKAIAKALTLNPRDPYIQSLAGKIAYREKNYSSALEHLHAALMIWPDMVEAHETLSATYRALGEKDKSIGELQAVLRIKKKMPTANQLPPFPIGSELFAVRLPSSPNR